MYNFRSFFLGLCTLTLSTGAISQDCSTPEEIQIFQKHAQQWVNTFIRSMDPSQINITANIIFLLYANGLLDHTVRMHLTPLSQLSRSIQNQLFSYNFPHKELASISIVIERLNKITFARALFNNTLMECEKFVNTHEYSPEFRPILEALDILQLFGQNSLDSWVKQHDTDTKNNLLSTSQILTNEGSFISEGGRIYKLLEQRALPFDIQENEKDLALIDAAKDVSYQLLDHLGKITDALNITNDHVNNLIEFGTEVYKYHYEALYQFMIDTLDNNHHQIIFGPYGVVPTEQRLNKLPHPQDILSHVVKISENYTLKTDNQ